jgi:hypothetical protein
VALEHKNAIQSLTYWSEKADPARDLHSVLDFYRGDSNWQQVEQGYWYWREDGIIRLWCSAAPAIGVAFAEFFATKAKLKALTALKQLDNLSDVTWVADDAVFELQRSFVEDNNPRLFEFAKRSEKVAASADGRDVFIVRNHHAYDVAAGFVVLNEPPTPEHGYATQVIICFRWDEDGQIWHKITLPRNAEVRLLRFSGEQCRLEVNQTTTGRVLTFEGPASRIRGINAGSISAHDDADLWSQLELEATSQSGPNP